MTTFKQGLQECWLKDKLKGFSVQSDIDHHEIKRLKAENDALTKDLNELSDLYSKSVIDIVELVEKMTGFQVKYNDLLADSSKLLRLQSKYMGRYTIESKMNYLNWKKEFQLKYKV